MNKKNKWFRLLSLAALTVGMWACQSGTVRVSVVWDGGEVSLSKMPSGVTVSAQDGHVTATVTRPGVNFHLSGSSDNGSFKLYGREDCRLLVDNLQLTNPRGSALNLRSDSRTYLTIEGRNQLSDGPWYEQEMDEKMKACVYGEGDLIVGGKGLLELHGRYKHALKTEGSLLLKDQFSLVVEDAVKDGLVAGKHILVKGGSVDVTVQDDAMKCPGDFQMDGGQLVLRAMGEDGSEGLEANTITVNGGELKVLAFDDAINAARQISFNGGLVYAYSTGNDAIDSNGKMAMNGGLVVAFGSQIPEGAFDCDWNPITVTGGTFFGVGGDNSRPSEQTASQGVLLYGASFEAGDVLRLTSGDQEMFTCVVPRDYFQGSVLFSSPALQMGRSYTVWKGGSVEGAAEAYCFQVGGQYSGGQADTSFVMESLVAQAGDMGFGPGFGPGGPGFGPGGPGFGPGGPGFDPDGNPNGGPGFGGPRPEGFPEGFDPSQMPKDFDPSKMPEGFDPSKMPGFDPNGGPMGGPGPRAHADPFPDNFPPATPSAKALEVLITE